MKIVYYGYRDWSLNIFKNINTTQKYLITTHDYTLLNTLNPDLIFFVGWSDIVPSNIISKFNCICLHPSPLPKYRGGSPLQNQIMNGEINSAVTLFIMDEGLDTGDIVYQEFLSLEGELDNIFKDIEKIGSIGINQVIEKYKNNSLIKFPQNNLIATSYKRRKEKDSEITINELLNSDPIEIYNKIRSLNDPYPNAYIRCKDGKKLFLINSNYEK